MDVFWRKNILGVAPLEWGLLSHSFPLYQVWHLDMGHSLFCFASSDTIRHYECIVFIFAHLQQNLPVLGRDLVDVGSI